MGVLWACVTGSGPSPAWIARVAKPLPSVRSRMVASLGWVHAAARLPRPSWSRTLPRMDRSDWWTSLDPAATGLLAETWIPVGTPGFAGDAKHRWRDLLDGRFGADGW